MTLSLATRTIMEKAALDNGFSQDAKMQGGWLIMRAHAAPASLCLSVYGRGFAIGTDHAGVAAQIAGLETVEGPAGFTAWAVQGSAEMFTRTGEIWRLARALPDAPLHEFQHELAKAPSTTEVERLRRERVGQNIFRKALMDFWNGACAVTGVAHPRLLRASHIIPWAECESDAERLNVHNGLLLAAHLDAAFDAHLVSFGPDGQILFSPVMKVQDRQHLRLHPDMRLTQTSVKTEKRLAVHRNTMQKLAETTT